MGQALLGGSSSSSKPVDMTPPEFKGLRGPFADVISQAFTGSGGPISLGGIPNYNTTPAAMTGNESTLLSNLMGSTAESQDLTKQTLAGNFLPGQSGSNPFLEAAITAAQRPTLRGLEETLSRALPGRFTQAGHFTNPQGSSPFDRAAAIATEGAANSLSDIASNLSFAGYESERNRQQGAITLQQQDVQTTINNLQAQALPRLIQQYGIDQGLQVFQTRMQAVLQALQLATGAPMLSVANQQKSTQTNGLLPTLLSPFSFNYGF